MSAILLSPLPTVKGTGYLIVNAAAAATILAGLSLPAAAQALHPEGNAATIYNRCLDKVESDPQTAYEDALSWHSAGGGLPARHCAAVALVGLRQYEEAATRFETLAREVKGEQAGLRTGLLAQAAQAWMLSGRAERAEQLQDRAIEAAPEDRQLRIDRAVTRLARGRSWEAIDDLNAALDQDPNDPEALLYRASAYRYLDALDLAREDVKRAIALDPKHPEAWLERGILEQLSGDREGARRSWMEVLALDPDGPAAAAARTKLESMDVKKR